MTKGINTPKKYKEKQKDVSCPWTEIVNENVSILSLFIIQFQ